MGSEMCIRDSSEMTTIGNGRFVAVVVVAVGWSGSGDNQLVVARGFSTLVAVVVVVVRCFFGFAKGTKNNSNSKQLQTSTKQQDSVGKQFGTK